VATAILVLPELGVEDQEFTGTWEMVSTSPEFPKQSVTPGSYKGAIQKGTISIDLNPGWADNNVVFWGEIKGELLTGQWFHATFAGGAPMGKFILRLDREKSR